MRPFVERFFTARGQFTARQFTECRFHRMRRFSDCTFRRTLFRRVHFPSLSSFSARTRWKRQNMVFYRRAFKPKPIRVSSQIILFSMTETTCPCLLKRWMLPMTVPFVCLCPNGVDQRLSRTVLHIRLTREAGTAFRIGGVNASMSLRQDPPP